MKFVMKLHLSAPVRHRLLIRSPFYFVCDALWLAHTRTISVGATVPRWSYSGPNAKDRGVVQVTTYVVEIDGLAILAFDAANASEAHAIARQESLKSDLVVLESAGMPLWNGTHAIDTRIALPEEAERFQKSLIDEIADNKVEDGITTTWVFLVPVNDPTNDDPEGDEYGVI